MHRSFLMVHKNLQTAKQKQSKYADKNSQEVDFKVGDPVYLKNHRWTNKLDNK